MPQACVTDSPGSRTSRSSPVTKALGGQVMGSMATAFVTADDLLVLEPGEKVIHTWGIQAFAG